MAQQEANDQNVVRSKKAQVGGIHCPMFFFPSYSVPSEPPGPVLIHPERILRNIVSINEAQCASLVRFPVRLPASLATDLKALSGGFGTGTNQQILKNLNQEETTLLFTLMDKLAKK